MHKLTLNIQGMKDTKCEGKIVAELKKLSGVLLVNADYKTETGVITFMESKVTPDEIAKAISSLGYMVTDNTVVTKRNLTKLIFGIIALLALIIIALELYPPSREFILNQLEISSNVAVTQDDPQLQTITLPPELQN